MISLLEYRKELISEISIEAIETSQHATDVFIDEITDILVNDYSYINDLEKCYFSFNKGNKVFKNMHIDAGYLDLTANKVDLLIADYNQEEIININNEFIQDKCRLMLHYFENTLKGFFRDGEISDPAVQLAFKIRENLSSIYKIHLLIASTNKLSQRIKTLELEDYCFADQIFKVELDVIDIQNIYNAKLPSFSKETITIRTEDYNCHGIQCIKADIGSSDYEAYLAIVPGKFLCDIYKKYGPRLLESNVRSFLNARGAVNKGIRNTILNERDKFFTYNNGIATIAKKIKVETKNNGCYITELENFQIINGGQTTASLASADIKDKAKLDQIFVPMKMTILKEEDSEIIHYISQYANSQNKVTNADLNSNHPFYIRMEDFSRKIFAPPVNNQTYQTLWFFERARGQYEQPKMNMTKSERDKYSLINPKNQKFTKTDLGKYLNSADIEPFYVAKGAEQNLIKFQEKIEKMWQKNKNDFNELFYKELISKAILFKGIEKTISNQEWYMENKAYRAQLVTYTFSKLIYEIKKIGKELNYKIIWDKQTLPDDLYYDIKQIAKLAFNVFNDPNRSFSNIGEYTKRKECWDALANKEYFLSEKTKKLLLSKEEKNIEILSSKNEEKLNNSLLDSIQIFQLGVSFWEELIKEGIEKRILTEDDRSFLEFAIKYCKGLTSNISSAQAKKIMEIKSKIENQTIYVGE